MTVQECIDFVKAHLEIKYATNNAIYKKDQIMIPTGCVNHSIGCAQPSVDVIYKLMNETSKWCVNAILGDFHLGDGRIILTMPLNHVPGGCGIGAKGSWNLNRIQWEVAEPAGHTYAGGTMINYDVEKNAVYFSRMWKMLVCWNVYCIHLYNYPVSAIADHSESYSAGYGSNHADMSHWLPKHGKSMDMLRNEVAAILTTEQSKPVLTSESIIAPAMSVAYAGIINITALALRRGPSITYPRVGRVEKNAKVTITGKTTKGDWCVIKIPDGTTGWVPTKYLNNIMPISTVISPSTPVEKPVTPITPIIPSTGIKDNTPDSWATEAVNWAVAARILGGDETGNYKLHNVCTRQEVIIFLYRLYKHIKGI